MEHFLLAVFLIFGHAHIFFSFIVVCTILKCYITHDAHLIMYKKVIGRFSESKKERIYYSFQCFFLGC
jgi:hypothetical protein